MKSLTTPILLVITLICFLAAPANSYAGKKGKVSYGRKSPYAKRLHKQKLKEHKKQRSTSQQARTRKAKSGVTVIRRCGRAEKKRPRAGSDGAELTWGAGVSHPAVRIRHRDAGAFRPILWGLCRKRKRAFKTIYEIADERCFALLPR